MINPIVVRGVLCAIPFFGNRILLVQSTLNFTLVVHAVETNDSVEENMELGVAGRVFRDLEQGPKDILHHLFEVFHEPGVLIHIVKTWNLDKPPHIWRK
jgi:hypothetical protein